MNKRRALRRYEQLRRRTVDLAAAADAARAELRAFERLTCLPDALKERIRREARAKLEPRRSRK